MTVKKNEELLQDWINEGYAIADIGDGAWGWTDIGKKYTSPLVRRYLSWLLYGDGNVTNYGIDQLYAEGFNAEGFIITD